MLELIHEAKWLTLLLFSVCGCHSMQFTVVTSLPLFDPQGAGADPGGQVADVVVVLCVWLSLHAVYCCNISACV